MVVVRRHSVADRSLAGVVAAHHLDGCPKNDGKVEPQTPIVDIPKVVIDALLDRCRRGSWSSASVYLRPPGQSRLYAAPVGIVPNNFVKFVVMGNRMRARPY